jgi:ATP-dependent DNA helicase RecQ
VYRLDSPNDGYNERLKYILEVLPKITEHGAVLIFVGRQRLAERLAADLVQYNYNAKGYHAGMESEKRKNIESWFLDRGNRDKLQRPPIVVGTTAFGMGIDKGDIRAVIHFDLPRSVEDCK